MLLLGFWLFGQPVAMQPPAASAAATSPGGPRTPELVAIVPEVAPMAAKPATVGSTSVQVVQRPWSPLKRYASARSALSDLLPAARAGDPAAMFGIARALQECRTGLWTERTVREAQAADTRLDGLAYDEEFARLSKARIAFCDVDTAESVGLYRRWLLAAADSGDSEAELYAAMFPPLTTDYVSWARAQARGGAADAVPRAHEAQALSLEYARRARDHGEYNALPLLMEANAEDGVADGDPVVRYENAWLLDSLLVGEGRRPMEKSLGRRRDALRPVEREMAEAAARDLIAKTPIWVRRPLPAEFANDIGVPLPEHP